ncbi:trypsin-like serine peptidase [Streptomyces sp. NPDC059063]|uniref:trypsin-like serine peptidase n=1 Tax=unclassified Streptomyces TaxID=2593676 RepID=UPI0036C799E7
MGLRACFASISATVVIAATATVAVQPSAWAAGPADGRGPSASGLEEFWTPERMAEAVPVASAKPAEPAEPAESAKGPAAARTSPSHPFKGIKQVGTFFWVEGSGGDRTYRFCGGTVVTSPGKNLVLSAAHCFDSWRSGAKLVFVPKHSGSSPQPYGIFPVKKSQIYADPRYLRPGGVKSATGLDFAVLKAGPRSDGKKLQDVVGSFPIGYNTGFRHSKTRVIGYPGFAARQNPLDCVTKMKKFTTGDSGGWKGGTFSRIDCAGYVSGTSGGPFITAGSERPRVVGLIGGWKTGGTSPDVSYSSYFDRDLKRVYDAAVAGRQLR